MPQVRARKGALHAPLRSASKPLSANPLLSSFINKLFDVKMRSRVKRTWKGWKLLSGPWSSVGWVNWMLQRRTTWKSFLLLAFFHKTTIKEVPYWAPLNFLLIRFSVVLRPLERRNEPEGKFFPLKHNNNRARFVSGFNLWPLTTFALSASSVHYAKSHW